MKTNDLIELRKMIDAAIENQIAEKDRNLFHAISNVVTGIAFDIGRIADALEGASVREVEYHPDGSIKRTRIGGAL